MNKKTIVIGLGVVVLAILAGIFVPARSPEAEEAAEKPAKAARTAEKAKKRKPARANRPKQAEKPAVKAETRPSQYDGWSESDRKLAIDIQAASDEDKMNDLIKLVSKAMQSTNATVRLDMVNALGWFGLKTLPELAGFLADSDPDVVEAALRFYEPAVEEIENEADRAKIIESSLLTITDENALDSLSMMLTSFEDQKIALETMIRVIIGGKGVAVKKVQENYRYLSGDEYVSIAAARAWLRENYTPPEKDEE